MNYDFHQLALTEWKKIIFILIILLIPPFVYAEKSPAQLAKSIENLRDKMQIPGASIAVIDKGKIIWAQGFGYADITTKRKVDQQTLFQAASITKTLTSAAVLKILDKHNIALDEPVNRYLVQWKIPENKNTEKVSVSFRLLLNHTAAISNPYPDGGYGPKDKLPTLWQVFKGRAPATNPPLTVTQVPGTQYQYCNGCYAVLQGALEEISHQSYPDIMQREILTPTHMTNSRFDNDFFIRDPEKIALPYDPKLSVYNNAPSRNPIYSTGLLWTTATDLAKYNIAITQALKKSNPLIKQSLASELVTPSHTPIHGLGYFIGDKNADEKSCGDYIFHAGANIGYLSLSIISKDGQQGAVVLINISPAWDAKDYPQYDFIKNVVKQIGRYYHCR